MINKYLDLDLIIIKIPFFCYILNNKMIKNNLSDLETNEEKEITIGIDLGTTYSCAAILRNNKVEIIPEYKTGNKILPSIVCFKSETQCLIGRIAKKKKLEYPESKCLMIKD